MSLTLDYTHTLAKSIGATHGLTDAEIDTLVAKFPKHHENIEELRTAGESCFFDLPYQDVKPVKALIKQHRGAWENLVVVGIGGATITPRSIFTALAHEHWNLLPAKVRKGGPRVFFLDNPDPRAITDLRDTLDTKHTLFLFVSKSGDTAEVGATYLWLREHLRKEVGKAGPTRNLMIATEPGATPLATTARADKTPIIDIPANLGDRFALLGTHNLFIGGLCGFDIDALLAGAAAMDQRCRHDRAMENPAYMHSLIHYLLTRKRRKTIHALMAFSNRIFGVVDWYSHMLSVSLGKMQNKKGKAVHVGPGPAYCLGPAGNYGQMQLYQEGPFDKVTTFLVAREHGEDLVVPKGTGKDLPLSYLSEVGFARLIDCGYQTAAQVITAAGRPNMTIILDTIDEATISGLYFLLELSTVMSAELYGIDAFNQPGIDANKHGVFAQLGRTGFEDKARVLAEFRSTSRKTC